MQAQEQRHRALHAQRKRILPTDIEFSTENHQGGVSSHASATPAGIVCDKGDIFSIKSLLQKLNPDSDRLFQRPKVKYSTKDVVWFTAQALG